MRRVMVSPQAVRPDRDAARRFRPTRAGASAAVKRATPARLPDRSRSRAAQDFAHRATSATHRSRVGPRRATCPQHCRSDEYAGDSAAIEQRLQFGSAAIADQEMPAGAVQAPQDRPPIRPSAGTENSNRTSRWRRRRSTRAAATHRSSGAPPAYVRGAASRPRSRSTAAEAPANGAATVRQLAKNGVRQPIASGRIAAISAMRNTASARSSLTGNRTRVSLHFGPQS